jgi:hypothetical protein
MRLLVCLAVLLGSSRLAAADEAAALDLLRKVSTAANAQDRLTAAQQLSDLGEIDAIASFLLRTRSDAAPLRAAVLVSINAPVPDKSGRFSTPNRVQDAQVQAQEKELDWLAELARLDLSTPGLGEVMADVAALRALGRRREAKAAQAIFDAAFAPDTMIYRDECGRQLRAMHPFSIPTLTIESQGKADRRRYATYQLERMDRQEPGKALIAAANNEDLEIAILDAFRATRHREAVYAVLSKIDDDSPRVRAAARAAWMEYVTGRAPPPAPKKFLALPGGKLDNKESPLWLTYRELADHELRKKASELLGEEYPERAKINLEAVSKQLFAHHDGLRQEREQAQLLEAKQLAQRGDLAGATALIDQFLVLSDDRTAAADLAAIYLARGKQLEAEQNWQGASAVFSKAHALATGDASTKALAAAHMATGRALKAQGKDGALQFKLAADIDPSYLPAKQAIAEAQQRPQWMLIAGSILLALAAVAFVVGMKKRGQR